RRDVLQGFANLRLLGPLALFVFGIMSLVGWILWHATLEWLPELVALGFLYLGVLPSTVQSATVYTSIAGGNVASSVVAAALLNLLGVFISAPLFAALAGTSSAGFDLSTFGKVAGMMLLPFLIGQAAQGLAGSWVRENRRPLSHLERLTIGLAVYVAFSGAVAEGIWNSIAISEWAGLVLGCGLLLLAGYGGSWLLARLLRLDRGDRIAMIFAGAQKSIALGAPLATVLFPPASAGAILLPLIVYHLAQMVAAAPVAVRLREG
ncbi:MAG: bile acid:sodium symporter, partial [Novosphingobium sp.]|nr:bile acid:sodium symporter [Novosphingobium sp.]